MGLTIDVMIITLKYKEMNERIQICIPGGRQAYFTFGEVGTGEDIFKRATLLSYELKFNEYHQKILDMGHRPNPNMLLTCSK